MSLTTNIRHGYEYILQLDRGLRFIIDTSHPHFIRLAMWDGSEQLMDKELSGQEFNAVMSIFEKANNSRARLQKERLHENPEQEGDG